MTPIPAGVFEMGMIYPAFPDEKTAQYVHIRMHSGLGLMRWIWDAFELFLDKITKIWRFQRTQSENEWWSVSDLVYPTWNMTFGWEKKEKPAIGKTQLMEAIQFAIVVLKMGFSIDSHWSQNGNMLQKLVQYLILFWGWPKALSGLCMDWTKMEWIHQKVGTKKSQVLGIIWHLWEMY